MQTDPAREILILSGAIEGLLLMPLNWIRRRLEPSGALLRMELHGRSANGDGDDGGRP
jgi:hypothetical protein